MPGSLTLDECNNACSVEETRTCVEFSLGRSDGVSPG